MKAHEELVIACNVEDIQQANLLIEMAGEQRPRFWEVLSRLAQEQLPAKPAPIDPFPPMDSEEAAQFEKWLMPYGKYIGYKVGELPISYLIWLTEGDEVVKLAKRYVRSKRFQDRQDSQEAGDGDE